ncbi:MAG: F0F1 ATP synthase subunit B [Candidatus Microsaccharimonas sp.]
MNFLTTFAETAETNDDIFTALGIDWKLLILQIVAFLILVWLLGKFVYPLLMKSVDERQKNIEQAAAAAKKAQESAAESEAETAQLLSQARKEADEIISTAKVQAAETLAASEEKAKNTAEQIVADAHDQVQKDIEAAKRELHNETLQLVALTTEKLIGKKLDKKTDEVLIAELLKGAK